MIWAVRQVELWFKQLIWSQVQASVCFTIKVALPPAALTGNLTNDQWMVRSITVIMHCRNELKISTVLLHNLSFGRIKTFIYLNWLEASNNYLVQSTYRETQNKTIINHQNCWVIEKHLWTNVCEGWKKVWLQCSNKNNRKSQVLVPSCVPVR